MTSAVHTTTLPMYLGGPSRLLPTMEHNEPTTDPTIETVTPMTVWEWRDGFGWVERAAS